MIARNVLLPACMGGFCDVRTSCARYHALNRGYPSERLCLPAKRDAWQPVTVEIKARLDGIQVARNAA